MDSLYYFECPFVLVFASSKVAGEGLGSSTEAVGLWGAEPFQTHLVHLKKSNETHKRISCLPFYSTEPRESVECDGWRVSTRLALWRKDNHVKP